MKYLFSLLSFLLACSAFGQSSTLTINTTTGQINIPATSGTPALSTVRVTPRVTAITYAAGITPAGDATDVANVGALTGNITINAPTGTPTDGQRLVFRFAQDGTGSRTLTWNAAFAFGTDVTEALIPSTASAKWEMVFQWHAGDSKWRAVGITRGF